MPDFLSEAEWKKKVNSLLGLIHGKTGITEALKAYESIRNKQSATAEDKKEALEKIITAATKQKTVHKSKPEAVKYLTAMIKAANEEIEGWEAAAAQQDGPLPDVAYNSVLSNSKFRKHFEDFLKTERSQENLDFYRLCGQLGPANLAVLTNLYRLWVVRDKINLPGTIKNPMSKIVEATEAPYNTMSEAEKTAALKEQFEAAKNDVGRLLQNDSFARFKKSPFYRKMVQAG